MGRILSEAYKALILYQIIVRFRQGHRAGIPPDLLAKLENASRAFDSPICMNAFFEEKDLIFTNNEIEMLARCLSVPQ